MDTIDYCKQHQIKLTPLRQSILNIIKRCGSPITAYEILDRLKKEKPKAQVMSVYRVLSFLLDNGLIHRIESLNAVMMCSHLNEKHISQWLICGQCKKTQECALPSVGTMIDEIETETGFSVTSPTIELVGLCADCKVA